MSSPPTAPPTLAERREVIHLLYRAGVNRTLLTKNLIDALVYLFRGLDADSTTTTHTESSNP